MTKDDLIATILRPDLAVRCFFADMGVVQESKEKIYVGLPGGTSLYPWFDSFKNDFLQEEHIKTLFQKCIFGFVDERLVSHDHDESNYKNIYTSFFSRLIKHDTISGNQIRPVYCDFLDPAKSYDCQVENFDIACYGLGPDGHIASLFPESEHLRTDHHGFIDIKSNPKDQYTRISVSPAMIRQQTYKYLFINGEAKKNAFEEFLDPNISIEQCPAKLLLEGGGDLRIVVSNLDTDFLREKKT